MMLNLLIAIMEHTFIRVKNDETISFYHEKALLLRVLMAKNPNIPHPRYIIYSSHTRTGSSNHTSQHEDEFRKHQSPSSAASKRLGSAGQHSMGSADSSE